MNFRRVRAILWQELFVLRRSYEVIADIIVFPFTNILVFGFISVYLSKENPAAAQFVITGMLLWGIIWIVQYSVTLGSLWNIWSRNLANLFIAPLQLNEYILAHTISGIVKSLLVLTINAVLCVYVFHFNLLSVGILPLVLAFANFVLFAYALGITLLGLIWKYGTRIQAVSWSLVGLIQPLVAAFYPLSVLPVYVQWVSILFSPTFVFEAVRTALTTGNVDWTLFGIAFVQNCVYCVIASKLFVSMYDASRDSGQFARNEA
ncbi:ABC transporter permease [bacterium]|nr:ABC transporter permease [bacterium]